MRKRQKSSALQLDQIQSRKLQEIGAYLCQHREHQGKTLDYLASQTKIQRRLLQAIEAGEMQALPEPVYIQALIRRFGDALGLPGPDLAAQFPLELGSKRSRGLSGDWTIGQLRPIHLYLFYVFVIFSAVNGLSEMMSRPLSPAVQSTPASLLRLNPEVGSGLQSSLPATGFIGQVPEELAAPLRQAFPLHQGETNHPGTWANNSARLTAQLPEPRSQAAQPVAVKLSLETQSWLRVTVDGATAFEGMMLAGSQRSWQGQDKITIRAGNAGGVLVTFNNGPTEPMGAPGAVEEKTFAVNGSKTDPETLALVPSPF